MMEKYTCFHMGLVRSIADPFMEKLGKWALPTKRAFLGDDIYSCSLLFGSPSLCHGKITEIVFTMLINSSASQYAATFRTH